MKLAEAKAVCAELSWREYDSKLSARLQAEIVERLLNASPQISSLDNGMFLLDASGLSHLGGESKFCRNIQKILNTAGFAEINIGIADSAFAAQVASKFKRSRNYIVPPGKDREFLSPLALQHLPLSSHNQETLRRLGLKTIGQLLQIPSQELQERFGQEGLDALDLASGIDKRKAALVRSKEVYESAVDLNFPVESLSQTQFILKSMLASIASRLKENGLLAEELLLSFFNSNEKFESRPLKLIRPSNNAKFLLEIIKLSLEAAPLSREYTGLHIIVTNSARESFQQNKIRLVESPANAGQTIQKGNIDYVSTQTLVTDSSLAPAEPYALLLQKFATRLGRDSVVRPVACDQHIPDMAASFMPLAEEKGAVLPIKINSSNSDAGDSSFACGLVLKKAASPEPVLVEYQGRTPSSITYRGRWHKIKELTEPEKLSGLWWDKTVRKSYYVAFIESGTGEQHLRSLARGKELCTAGSSNNTSYLVLLVCDHENNSWQLEGFFD